MPIQFGEIKTAAAIRDLFDQYWYDIDVQPGEVIDDSVFEAKLGVDAFEEGEQVIQEVDVRTAIENSVQGFADAVPGGNGSDGDLTVSGTTYLQTDRVYQYNNLHITSTGRIYPTGSGTSLRILVKDTLRVDSGGIIGFDGSSGANGASGAIGGNGSSGAYGTGRTSGGGGGPGGNGGAGGAPNGGAGGLGGIGGRGGDGETSGGAGPYAGLSGNGGAAGANGGSGATDTTSYTAATDYSTVIGQTGIAGRRYGIGAGAKGATGGSGNTGATGGTRSSYKCGYLNLSTCYNDGTRGRGGTGGKGGQGGGGGGTGGTGAGAIYIEAKNIQISGTIHARGGSGGSGGGSGSLQGEGGQGGAGGLLVLKYHNGIDNGAWQVNGGAAGSGNGNRGAGPVGHIQKVRRN